MPETLACARHLFCALAQKNANENCAPTSEMLGPLPYASQRSDHRTPDFTLRQENKTKYDWLCMYM